MTQGQPSSEILSTGQCTTIFPPRLTGKIKIPGRKILQNIFYVQLCWGAANFSQSQQNIATKFLLLMIFHAAKYSAADSSTIFPCLLKRMGGRYFWTAFDFLICTFICVTDKQFRPALVIVNPHYHLLFRFLKRRMKIIIEIC